MNRSKLLKLTVRNIGCVGNEGVTIELDDIVCLVGRNNAGKSTMLKAYELAQGSEKFAPQRDRCSWAPEDSPSEVELFIHIPKGIANISEDWKEPENDNLVLRSRWQWSKANNFIKTRTTWNPKTKSWADEGNAGGADNVFKSRLPRPLRIGSLEDADKTEAVLLALALDPFIQEVVKHQSDPESELAKSVSGMIGFVDSLSKTHEENFKSIAEKVQKSFGGVFPGVNLRLQIAMEPPPIKIPDLLKAGSGVRIEDGRSTTSVAQQGTGARRALFWSMLRVHNELKRLDERMEEHKKALTRQLRSAKADTKAEIEAKIAAINAGAPIPHDEEDPALPGYLLLIDEPENALHPMASRAAQRHLYELATDPDWQIIMTTHSPYFINPLADHTTIVRLQRTTGDESPLYTRVYRSETMKFSDDEKPQLKALQQMDAGFSEVFFGSYPVLVEGDTEHAAFLAAITKENHEVSDKVTIIRARGKAILPALIKMLHHFKIDFGIVHDVDWPFTSRGKNSMWSTNSTIHAAISVCRADNILVRHRYSIPDFERYLGGEELGKDKPLETYLRIKSDNETKDKVQTLS